MSKEQLFTQLVFNGDRPNRSFNTTILYLIHFFFIELQLPKITIKYKFTGLDNHLNLIIHFHYTVQPFTNYPVP